MNQNKYFLWAKNHRTAVLVIVGILLVLGFVCVREYPAMRFGYAVRQQEKEQARALEAYRAEQMKDTFGGKTPQETLLMYIDAVEKGDYELASQYMILGKKEQELVSLRKLPAERIQSYIESIKPFLKDAKKPLATDEHITLGYSDGSSQPDFAMDFILYPNGVWKIEKM
jgi:hypothetical protein